ncbi:MAG: hypothetical protein EOO51_12585 [Flavobacterium sp.]|nr:MAG: hypothetical protein EOO51_12585 [Flavobacterium sp.]
MDKSKVIIEIGEHSFVLQFGYSTFRNLGDMWGFSGMEGVIEKMTSLDVGSGRVPFEAIETLADIILAGISRKDVVVPDEIDRDAVCDYIVCNTGKVSEIMQAFIESMAKPDAKGKPKPAM